MVWVLCCGVDVVLWCGYCVVVWVLCRGVGIVSWCGYCVVVWTVLTQCSEQQQFVFIFYKAAIWPYFVFNRGNMNVFYTCLCRK